MKFETHSDPHISNFALPPQFDPIYFQSTHLLKFLFDHIQGSKTTSGFHCLVNETEIHYPGIPGLSYFFTASSLDKFQIHYAN